MKILKINLDQPQQEIIAQACEALRQGSVVVHPTETCYGLAVDIFQQDALQRLYTVKGRNFQKPVSMMVRDLVEAQDYAVFNPLALQLAEKFWPGPLTLVLPRQKMLPDFFNPGHDAVGIRCPDSAIAQALMKGFGGPLSTTSANVSGQSETYTIADFLQQYKQNPDPGFSLPVAGMVILDGRELLHRLPSTVVGFEGGKPKIFREGSFIQAVKVFLKSLKHSQFS